MVSIGPYTESLNYTHKFNLCSAKAEKPNCRNTLMGMLEKNSDFSTMKNLVKKAKLEGIYDSLQSDLTLFIPSDKSLNLPPNYIKNMDLLTARKLVKFLTLNRKIYLSIIQAQPVISLVTKLPSSMMYITNLDCRTIIHECTLLLYGDIEVDNGLIHVIDNLPSLSRLTTASYFSQTY
jgi:uncharacterized surface protein with fasciclin (FAS1) repeats